MINVRFLKEAVEELKKSNEDKCPLCHNKLYYREPAKGFVCKNIECENFWEYGKGKVFYKQIIKKLKKYVLRKKLVYNS